MPARPVINKNVMKHFSSTGLLGAQKNETENFKEDFISDKSWLTQVHQRYSKYSA